MSYSVLEHPEHPWTIGLWALEQVLCVSAAQTDGLAGQDLSANPKPMEHCLKALSTASRAGFPPALLTLPPPHNASVFSLLSMPPNT